MCAHQQRFSSLSCTSRKIKEDVGLFTFRASTFWSFREHRPLRRLILVFLNLFPLQCRIAMSTSNAKERPSFLNYPEAKCGSVPQFLTCIKCKYRKTSALIFDTTTKMKAILRQGIGSWSLLPSCLLSRVHSGCSASCVAHKFKLERSAFIRGFIWYKSGLGSLRKIRSHLEDYEPRYDRIVIPVGASSPRVNAGDGLPFSTGDSSSGDVTQGLLLRSRLPCPLPFRRSDTDRCCESCTPFNPPGHLLSRLTLDRMVR